MAIVTTDRQLRGLLSSARVIAVVGLTDRASRDSFRVSRYMQRQGYTIIPVNPSITEALGVQAFPDLRSIPGAVDIVNIFRRPEFVPDIVDAAIAIKAKAVWMQLGTAHPKAAQRASDAGLQVVMDRCIMIEHSRLMSQA